MAMALERPRRRQAREQTGIRLTDRDRDLFGWINGHGFVTVAQVARWMGVHYQTAQRRLRLLVQHGYLQSHPPTALRIDRLEAMQGVECQWEVPFLLVLWL